MKERGNRVRWGSLWLVAIFFMVELVLPSGGEARARARKRKLVKARKSLVWVDAPRVLLGNKRKKTAKRVWSRILSRAYKLRRCYDRLRKSRPKLTGKVKISFVIRRNGRVREVKLSSLLPQSLKRCVRTRVQRWRLRRVPKKIVYGPLVVRFWIEKTAAERAAERLKSVVLGNQPGRKTHVGVLCDRGMDPKKCRALQRKLQRETDERSRSTRSRRRPARPTRRSRMSFVVPPVRGATGAAAKRTRAKIRSRVYGFRACHRRALRKQPKLQGSAKITFQIKPNGRTRRVKVTARSLPLAMRTCLQKKVGRWYLGGQSRRINYGPLTVRFFFVRQR